MKRKALKYLVNYYGFWGLRRLYTNITKNKINFKNYAGKTIYTAQQGNDYIKKMLMEGKPFMAGRLGSSELDVVNSMVGIKVGAFKKINKRKIDVLCQCSGFFPNTADQAQRFANLMLDNCEYVDIIGAWNNIMEDYIINNYAPNSILCDLKGLEPYYHINPWSEVLQGKEVLVIHPFEKTIISQFSKRKYLFPNTNILPEFNLKTIKAVQTIAGEKSEFKDWFEALDYMYKKALDTDFDLAIIGCGAYGFPLAAMLKRAGKKTIHLGGATQLLFGIKGNRWDDNPTISKLYNDYWVRPDITEVPKQSNMVEGACYW